MQAGRKCNSWTTHNQNGWLHSQVGQLGFPLGQELATNFMGHHLELPYAWGGEGLSELCGMLKTTEGDIKKSAGSSDHVDRGQA
jgi:hypothetical protein